MRLVDEITDLADEPAPKLTDAQLVKIDNALKEKDEAVAPKIENNGFHGPLISRN